MEPQSPRRMPKVFNDPVHGHMSIPPLCVKIIDTPEFQRLRFIKQLGSVYFVYPGASHNRFEHSLGVCYLAGRLVRTLQKQQPDLNITEVDVLCVQISGLCHDLGHGPFSHLFERTFMRKISPVSRWTHEEASVKMFNYMVATNNLVPEFEHYGLSDDDREFIKELMHTKDEDMLPGAIWQNKKREETKRFLYEIVSNKRNGIDVDRWDYCERDCLMLGIRTNFDFRRCMKFIRVIQVDGQLQICFRDKENGDFYDMFYMRAKLHRRAYQHKIPLVIDEMIGEALIKANDYITFEGIDGTKLKMHQTINDMKAFSQLTDDIITVILSSSKEELQESAQILRNVLSRKLYRFVAEKQPKFDNVLQKFKTVTPSEIARFIPTLSAVTKNDIVLQHVRLDYGMRTHNPVQYVRFYSKHDVTKAHEEEIKMFLPERFSEEMIRIYSKKTDDDSCEILKKAFDRALDSNAEDVCICHIVLLLFLKN